MSILASPSPLSQPLVWLILLFIFYAAYRSRYTYLSRQCRPSFVCDHETKVRQLADNVKDFYKRKLPFRIYHGSTCSTRPMHFRRDEVVDTSGLSLILHVDPVAQTILTEPNVTIRELVVRAMSKGLLPKVVMEFPEVTVGGAFSGASGNSSCFRHGLFEQTVEWIEVVLADGEIVTASPQERPDLFYGAAGTFGTLGVVTALRVQCVVAKPLIELEYHVRHSKTSVLELIDRQSQRPDVDYLDGILFARELGIVMSGRLISGDEVIAPIATFTGRKDPWFCTHARAIAAAGESVTITVPVVDYFFRYDQGAFWGGHAALRYFRLPNAGWIRWLMDSYLRAGPLTQVIHTAKLAEQFLVQDLAVPIERAIDFLEYVDREIRWYPIWLCPVTDLFHGKAVTFTSSAASKTATNPDRLIDIGIYGAELVDVGTSQKINRGLEGELHRLGGQKALFAASYYTKDEFWAIYEQQWYNDLRAKYNASSLPTVYDKVQNCRATPSVAAATGIEHSIVLWFWKSRPLPGLFGLAKLVLGSDYLFVTS